MQWLCNWKDYLRESSGFTNGWKEIGSEESQKCFDRYGISKFTQYEIKKLRGDIKRKINYPNDGTSVIISTPTWSRLMDQTRSLRGISSPISKDEVKSPYDDSATSFARIEIYKLQDEYFLVYNISLESKISWFLCDELNGLVNYLKTVDLIKETKKKF